MLVEAICGFGGQIGGDFEVLIADNGSAPEESAQLRQALKRLPRSIGVRTLEIENPSIPGSRNRLTDEARGRYICIADDDDIPLPNRLADHLACFTKDATVHGSHGGWIDFDQLTGLIGLNTGGHRTLANFAFGPGRTSAHPACFYRTDVLKHFRYDETFRVGSDYDLALRMASMGCTIEHTGTYVTLRRFHEGNVTLSDLSGQITNGTGARQRVRDSLGNRYAVRLRDSMKKPPPPVSCRPVDRDGLLDMLPGYSGVWRLLVPLGELGQTKPAGGTRAGDDARLGAGPGTALIEDREGVGAEIIPMEPAFQSQFTSSTSIAERANQLADLMGGDVGVVDCRIDPCLFYISRPIKGVSKAMKLRRVAEERLDVGVEIMADVEYRERRRARFDWAKLAHEGAERLVSRPRKDLGHVLAALNQLQAGTMLRAMTSVLADFNCTDQLYHLVTVPIPGSARLGDIKRLLERQTGERFEVLAHGQTGQNGGMLS